MDSPLADGAMSVWRWCVALVLITLAAMPLILPFGEALIQGMPRHSASGELTPLVTNTLLLVGGTLAVALPLGVLLAILLFRTDMPGRQLLLGGTIFALFIPLPLLVAAWQGLLGSDGFFPVWFWGSNADRPWSAGLVPAIWVHGLAGLPWVVLIVGIGLNSVESELEEEALLATGPRRVLWRVTLPRCRGTIAAAALWLILQTAAEITVTDVFLVPTVAEEIHTQFTMGGEDALARTLLVSFPGIALTWVALLLLIPRLERSLPPLQLGFTPSQLFSLGRLRWLWLCGCVVASGAVFVGPLLSLVWKVGLAGTPRSWSAAHASRQLLVEADLYGVMVLETLAVALLTGALAAASALVACWTARHNRPLRVLLLSLVTLAWALPAPVVGIGLKELIMAIVRWLPLEPLPQLLYYGPSPAPIVWVHLLRFFPFAVAILWPAVRLVPMELRDAALLEGASPWQELWHIYVPATWRPLALCLMSVTALSLGEIGASVRVETPSWETFAKLLFDRMHYGVDNNVAALSLILLVEIAVAAVLFEMVLRSVGHAKKKRQ
jgi:iron(III) transport system permease protein